MYEVKLQSMLFGCVFLALVGLRLLFVKTADTMAHRRKYFEILIVWGAAVVFFYPVLNEKNIFSDCLILNHLYIPIYFIFGPAIYLVTLCFLGKYRDRNRTNVLLFVPAMAAFAVEIIAYIIHPSLFEHRPIELFQTDTLHLFDWIEYAGFTYNAVFFAFTGIKILKTISLDSVRNERSIRLFLFEIACISIGMGVTATGYVIRNKEMAVDGILILIVLAIIAFIFTDYHEHAYQEIGQVVERYQKSRLEGVDIRRLEQDIGKKMSQDKLFTEDSLTLAGLSDELGVKPYQLSEYLNNHKQMNFSRFINEYRISEACRLLVEDSQANIIHIAYAVGYNSKANFNLAFKTITGMTPSEYLKKKGKKS
jgi:AraC-like DNA-binding protein